MTAKKIFGWYSVFVTLLVVTVIIAVQLAAAQEHRHDYPELSFTVQDDAIVGPDSIEAGFYSFVYSNESALEPDLSIARLKEGSSVEEVLSAVETVVMSFAGQAPPGEAMASIAELVSLVGGQSIPPGAVLELTPGDYLIFSVGANETGQSHTSLGLYKALTVTESAAAAVAPTADLSVDMRDFAFTIPDELPAGEQTWEVQNVGQQIHHLVLMRVKDGRTMEEAMAALQGPPGQGEPPVEQVGLVNVLSPTERNFVTFHLAPGSYIALCFMPDYQTGAPHVALGMIDTFTVVGE